MWRVLLSFFVTNVILVLTEDAGILNSRNELVEKQKNMMLGSDIVLTDSEEKVNELIMKLKYEVLDNGFKDSGAFNLSKHFFVYKDEVNKTELFKIIQDMPKGAVLHAHDTGLLGPDYVVELTYLPDLYVCFQSTYPLFIFSENLPNTTCETQWQSMEEARYSSGNTEQFDKELRRHFTMVIDNPNEVYTDVDEAWVYFQQYFITTGPIFNYKPVWEQYFYDILQAFSDDKIMYIEVRSVLPELYDLKENTYSAIDTALSYKKVLEQFMKDHPDFYGAKLIYAPLRFLDHNSIELHLQIAKELKKLMPTFFAGFDLVGQEDKGTPLKDLLFELDDASQDLDFFFHAGETNCNGMPTDENLYDAIVLKTKRIGHAFALVKHPVLLEEVKRQEIALEVNVISNVVLKLVHDVRNHPLAQFLAKDLPVVLSSDDPGIWEAEPLSHDFYVAFVGVASRWADLRLLKKLAINSITYSSANDKDKMLYEFEIRWTKFIDNILREKVFH